MQLGFRSIGSVLGVSNVTILNWVKSFGEEVAKIQSETQYIEFVEVDEIHSYIGYKKLRRLQGKLLKFILQQSFYAIW